MPSFEEVILDHYHHPRNMGSIPDPTHHANTENRSCGDTLSMDMSVRNDIIEAIGWSGNGCALSQGSASLLSEFALGKNVSDIRALSPENIFHLLGKSDFSPTRARCALLSLETIHHALSPSQN
ncbi:MAG: iron-sulfur cluster assembly scaffold protein [Candidatus Moraniibacteriota bacterium]|nr:MAG: iron-sulfur cluster assembly scaffold protein [Candidatus Moranbacteria bacterium]